MLTRYLKHNGGDSHWLLVVVKKKFLGHPQKFQKVPKSFKISFFSPLKFIRTYFNLLILARTFWNF